MARRDPSGLDRKEGFTKAEGRKFGLSVGLAFVLLAVLLGWRGHLAASYVVGGVGALLSLSGALVPGRLGPAYRGWMALAERISRVTTPVILGLVYLAVLTPTGLLMRLFGRNPLEREQGSNGTFWLKREERSRRDMHRQF